MPIRWGWPPDDPRWLRTPADLRVMDVTVLRQVGVPEAIITLAERDRVVDSARSERTHSWRGFPDLSFLDELEEDPDARPYTWDLPEGCE